MATLAASVYDSGSSSEHNRFRLANPPLEYSLWAAFVLSQCDRHKRVFTRRLKSKTKTGLISVEPMEVCYKSTRGVKKQRPTQSLGNKKASAEQMIYFMSNLCKRAVDKTKGPPKIGYAELFLHVENSAANVRQKERGPRKLTNGRASQ